MPFGCVHVVLRMSGEAPRRHFPHFFPHFQSCKVLAAARRRCCNATVLMDTNQSNRTVPSPDAKRVPPQGMSLATGIAIGIAIGAAIGVAMNNIAVGIGFGIGIGIALSLATGAAGRRRV
jgi:hypothetical protein